MAAPVDLMRRVSLFSALDDAELAKLAERCQERRFNDGAPVTTAGARGNGFFVIAEGRATVRVHGRVQRRLGRGDYFGELALIDGGRRTADISADTDMLCYGLSQKEFRAFVERHPDAAWTLLQRVVGLLREAQAHHDPRRRAAARTRLGRRLRREP